MVWTAYSRRRHRVIAHTIGEGLEAAKRIYKEVKALTPKIDIIYTDANSCYEVAFKQMKIKEPHEMSKKYTHLIESSNSSIRDNLARFNRRSKRFSKSLAMLDLTLNLFFHRQLFTI